MANYRVLVCGGRDFDDHDLMFRVLNGILSDRWGEGLTIIHGGARGADRLAGSWAEYKGVDVEVYLADWNKHGKQAGYIRNSQMLEEGQPDLVVAFEGGRGTAMMVELAHDEGVPVEEY
jgi:hypothetical protein